MDERWKITSAAERTWLRSALGQGGGVRTVTGLVGGSGFCSAPVHAQNRYQRTPLHIAADFGWSAALEVLLDHRADTAATDDKGDTALHLAVRAGVTESALRRLAGDRRTVHTQNAAGDTALHVAALCRRGDAARVILEEWSPLCVRNVAGKTAGDVAEAREADAVLVQLARAERWREAGGLVVVLAAAAAADAGTARRRLLTSRNSPSALTARAYKLLAAESSRKSFHVATSGGGGSDAVAAAAAAAAATGSPGSNPSLRRGDAGNLSFVAVESSVEDGGEEEEEEEVRLEQWDRSTRLLRLRHASQQSRGDVMYYAEGGFLRPGKKEPDVVGQKHQCPATMDHADNVSVDLSAIQAEVAETIAEFQKQASPQRSDRR